MPQPSPAERLSRISTLWTLVRKAHGAPAAEDAWQRLMELYGGAVHRYLLGALRDADAADELFQEFSLRFLRGDFRNAQPERGRFRDYVKTSLFHLVAEHQRRRRAGPQPLGPEIEPAAPSAALAESEQAFLESWREQLMDRTWQSLAELEARTGLPHHTILRLRTDQPSLSSAQLAEQFGARLGKTYAI